MVKTLRTIVLVAIIGCIAPMSAVASEHVESSKTDNVAVANEDWDIEHDPDFLKYVEKDQEDEQTDDGLDFREIWGSGAERTKSKTPTKDQNIGVLWWVQPGLIRDTAHRTCTASHVGGRFWITARHCFDDLPSHIGFIETSDGQFAGIERWWLRAKWDEIAVIRLGSGLSNKPSFRISDQYLSNGTKFWVNGFAGEHRFSSKNEFVKIKGNTRVIYRDSDGNIEDEFEKMVDYGCVTESDECGTMGGDSGSPGYIGNVQYLIHSGSSEFGGKYRGYAAALAPHAGWVDDVKRRNPYTRDGDRIDAFRGGLAAKYAKRSGLRVTNKTVSSSSGSS